VFRGVILLLHVRNVTAVDFDDNDFPHYDLTLQTLTWDPTSNVYGVQERVKERDMMNLYGDIEDRPGTPLQTPTLLLQKQRVIVSANVGIVTASQLTNDTTSLTQTMTDHD